MNDTHVEGLKRTETALHLTKRKSCAKPNFTENLRDKFKHK